MEAFIKGAVGTFGRVDVMVNTTKFAVRALTEGLRVFHKMAIPADSIAYGIEQPTEVEIDEVVIRPTPQDF